MSNFMDDIGLSSEENILHLSRRDLLAGHTSGPYQRFYYNVSCHSSIVLTPPVHIERNEISGGMSPTVDVYRGAFHSTLRGIF